jgi:undecaprenyl diphosphate synthase
METEHTPACIGFIVDGNRRWARAQNRPLHEGHEEGAKKIHDVIKWSQKKGVACAIFYCFSTENWNRSPEEVSALMMLFETELTKLVEHISENVCVRFIGDRTRFSMSTQEHMRTLEEKTAARTGMTAVIALSYGGRAEIVRAIARAREEGEAHITEETLSRHLDTSGLPDPDIIVRTSGEKRLSNFLPWQSVYSELFFIDTLWPDFTEGEFEDILKQYAERDRRRGR